MTIPRETRQKLASLRRNTSTIKDNVATFDRNLTLAILAIDASLDGWPAVGGDGGSSGGVSDPVGRMIAARSHVLELQDQLFNPMCGSWTLLVELSGTVARQLLELSHAGGVRETKTDPTLCSGGAGMDGAIEWGDPTCEQIVHATGLCASCWSAHRRWKLARAEDRHYARRPRTADGAKVAG
jgi:hypothetical protein